MLKINIQNVDWIINIGVSKIDWFRIGKPNLCYCLTTSPKFKRLLHPIEALRLQAIPYKNYDFNNFTDNQIFKFAGNCMSVNVLMAIFINLL